MIGEVYPKWENQYIWGYQGIKYEKETSSGLGAEMNKPTIMKRPSGW